MGLLSALISGIVDNHVRSTLSDGVQGVGGGCASCWSVGQRILWSCWMACVRAMSSLVEDGTVLSRAVSMSVAWRSVRSVSEIVGVAQCIG